MTNTNVYFPTDYFQLAGLSAATSFNGTVGIAGAMVAGNMFGWWAVDFLGRRKTMLYGGISLDVALFLIGGLAQSTADGVVWAQIAFMAIWAFLYQGTLGTVQWSIAAEAPASSLRASTMSLATMCNTIFTIVWAVAMPYAMNPDQGNLGGKIAFLFGSVLTVSIVFAYFFIPETKGRTFLEIDELWRRGTPLRKFHKTNLVTVTE
jgi:hypothetical protein